MRRLPSRSPASSTNQASLAPSLRAASLASAAGSSITVLMSQRAQRVSGMVLTAMPASAAAASRRRRHAARQADDRRQHVVGRKQELARSARRARLAGRRGRRATRLRRMVSRSTRDQAPSVIGCGMRSSPSERRRRCMCRVSSTRRPPLTSHTSYTASANWKPRSSACTAACA